MTAARIPWPGALIGLALAVASSLLARIAFGLLAAAWTVRAATLVLDPRLRRELDRTREQLRIGRAVTLAMSPRLRVPFVSGLLRPTLVLPADALQWTAERIRAIFLHELAHVRRHDAVGLVISRVATALFWFHPLVWSLSRVVRRECERACDDVVLTSGLRASDYADHLLAIAREAVGQRTPGMTLAFARTSSLEGRLVTLLRSDLKRGPASTRVRWAVAGIALVLLIPLSGIRVVGASAESAETPFRSTLADDPGAVTLQTKESLRKHEEIETTKRESKEQSWKEEESTSSAFGSPSSFGTFDPALLETAKLEAEIAESKSPAGLYSRAKELYNAERYGDAGLAYEAAARGQYRTATAWYNAACSYSLARQKLRALGALKKAIDAGWDDAGHIQRDEDLNYIRDDARFRLMLEDLMGSDQGERQRDRAVAKYEALHSSASDDASAWNSAGVALMRAGETELAIKAFQRRVGIDGSPSGIYNEACAEALGGHRNAALQSLERAIVAGYGSREKLESDPDLSSLYKMPAFESLVELADDLTIRHQGNDDKEPDAWRRELPRYEAVARKHAGLARAWFNLGYVQLRAGDPESSQESFARALDKDYRRPTTLYNLACASAQAGDRDKAMRWLAQAEAAGHDVWGSAKHDHDLDPMRRDDRFRAMMDRLERRHEEGKSKHNKKS